MAECGCSKSVALSEQFNGICEVCRLLDNDATEKIVSYCEFCGVNICCNHRNKIGSRTIAAFLKLIGK